MKTNKEHESKREIFDGLCESLAEKMRIETKKKEFQNINITEFEYGVSFNCCVCGDEDCNTVDFVGNDLGKIEIALEKEGDVFKCFRNHKLVGTELEGFGYNSRVATVLCDGNENDVIAVVFERPGIKVIE